MGESTSRDLLRGNLDLMVLSVLADGPKYGYLIQKRIQQASSEQVKLAAGTLYPLLHRLEDDKLIRAKWDTSTGRKRCWYELTAKGTKRLNRQASQWQKLVHCMDQLLGEMIPQREGSENAGTQTG